jgi:glutamine cyclotransferase
MKHIIYIVACSLCAYLISCGSEKEKAKSPRIKNSTYIISPKSSDRFTLADSILVTVGLRSDSMTISKVVVRVGLDTLAIGSNADLRLPPSGKVGDIRLNISAKLSSGKTESYSVTTKVFADSAPDEYTYRIINTYPHQRDAYTQGLLVHNGQLYESNGERGSSDLRILDITNGNVEKKINIEDRYFGEGLTLWQNKLFQLTWTANTCLVYDVQSLEEIGQFDYATEGWGITTIGDQLVMSDGTDNLYFRDPETFELLRQGQVRDDQRPIFKLNELEYIDGRIYANIYPTDEIVIINPETFAVEGRINLNGILDRTNYSGRLDVLNGIAYDSELDKLFVTGKLWPKLFEIELVKREIL